MPLLLHDNVIEGITPVATNEVTDFEGVNVNNWLLYNSWKPGVTGTQDLVFDLGSAKSVDTFCVYGHNLFTEGCSLTLSHSTDDISYTDAVAAFVVAGNGVIFKQFTSQSKRYWRIRITNCTVDAVISVAAMGVATALPEGMDLGFEPPVWGEVKNINSVSVNGNFLGRSNQPVPSKMRLKQSHVTEAFIRGDWTTFIAHAQALPFFFTWDEINQPGETVYAWTDKTIARPRYTNHNLLSVNLPIMALRD